MLLLQPLEAPFRSRGSRTIWATASRWPGGTAAPSPAASRGLDEPLLISFDLRLQNRGSPAPKLVVGKPQRVPPKALLKNRVEGEFASTDEDSVIPFEWVEAATERWQVWKDSGEKPGLTVVGVDVARSGADKTVLALRAGDVVTELRTFHHEDTMVTSGRQGGGAPGEPRS